MIVYFFREGVWGDVGCEGFGVGGRRGEEGVDGRGGGEELRAGVDAYQEEGDGEEAVFEDPDGDAAEGGGFGTWWEGLSQDYWGLLGCGALVAEMWEGEVDG